MTSNFGDAPRKMEGQPVWPTDDDEEYDGIETTYVERRVPVELEDEAHALIDNWLKEKGFDPEEI